MRKNVFYDLILYFFMVMIVLWGKRIDFVCKYVWKGDKRKLKMGEVYYVLFIILDLLLKLEKILIILFRFFSY